MKDLTATLSRIVATVATSCIKNAWSCIEVGRPHAGRIKTESGWIMAGWGTIQVGSRYRIRQNHGRMHAMGRDQAGSRKKIRQEP